MAEFIIRYSTGAGSNLGKTRNVAHTWEKFLERFKTPVRTLESVKEYKSLSRDEQTAIKGSAGWFFRAQTSGGSRNRNSGRPSDLITLDLDYATPEFVKSLKSGEVLPGFTLAACSTRSHTKDNPRLRLLIPCAPPVLNEVYPAVSRILAKQIDPSMCLFDPVSFRAAQMMFYPTVSADQSYLFIEQKGDILDTDLLLLDFEAEVGDWRDHRNLPVCPGEELRERAEKAENPLNKNNIIGDFCRAYSVPDAIEKFLPHIYQPVDDASTKPRYTYIPGSSTSGAVVEDDGLFLYSHHSSDPCGDRLVNAFDLVRIHLFGHLDEGVSENKGLKAPSAKAMAEFIAKDSLFRKTQLESRYAIVEMFDDAEASGAVSEIDDYENDPEVLELVGPVHDGPCPRHIKAIPGRRRKPVEKDWVEKLDLKQDGSIKPTASNLICILQNDLRLRECFEYDEFAQRVKVRYPIRTRIPGLEVIGVSDKVFGDSLQDFHLSVIRVVLSAETGPGKLGWGLNASMTDVQLAVDLAARTIPYNSAMDALFTEEWDHKPRLDTLGVRYLGCEDNIYYREVFSLFLIAAVARIYEPGHKFDLVPILEGPQGVGKSTFISTLARGFFGNLTADMGDDKRLAENMKNKLIMEIPELSSMRRSQLEATKSFLTQTEATYREAFGREPKDERRRCVFMGTTNERTYLIDRTGNRRLLPVEVRAERIDIPALRAELDQLWAEARYRYFALRQDKPRAMGDLDLFLSDEATTYLNPLHAEKMEETEVEPLAGEVFDALMQGEVTGRMGKEPIYYDQLCLGMVWKVLLRKNSDPKRMDLVHLGQAMRSLGWERKSYANFKSFGKQPRWIPMKNGKQISGAEWVKLNTS